MLLDGSTPRHPACSHSEFSREAAARWLGLLACFALSAGLVTLNAHAAPGADGTSAASPTAVPIVARHIGVPRDQANRFPTREEDQAIVEGWPMYRTERGQEAFNHAMATLRATEGPSPDPRAFAGCQRLRCPIAVPRIGSSGWIPPGRLWLSPDRYILFVQSRRPGLNQRRPPSQMRIFVFHEFHNSTRNTDVFDTISAHRGSVFTPFYMSKAARDAEGRTFVTVVQVAPFDVVSRHATNHGNLGPGIEVAKNYRDQLEPIQSDAGIVIGHMISEASPALRFVHHRGIEGLPMLRAYQRWVQSVGTSKRTERVKLPFTPADRPDIATAAGTFETLLRRDTPPLLVAAVERPAEPAGPEPRRGPAHIAASTSAMAPLRLTLPQVQTPPEAHAAAVATPAPRLVSEPEAAPRLLAPPRLADPPRAVAAVDMDRLTLGLLVRQILAGSVAR